MANDKDITIGLKTEGDTSGAEAVKDSIRGVDSAAEQAQIAEQARQARQRQGEADVIEARRRVNERAVSEAAKLGAQSVTTNTNIANLGGAMNQLGYQVTDFTVQVQGGTSALMAFSQQAPQALGALTMLGGGVKSLSQLMSVSVGIMTPLTLILTELTLGGRMAYEAFNAMRAAQDDLTAASARHAEQLEFQSSQQKKLNDQVRQEFIAGVYKKEADELARQVQAIERINALRGELGNIEQSRANRQIDIAKASGGDVALAEANALAVKLRTGLEEINGQLNKADARVQETQRLAEQARMQYERAANTITNPEELEKLDQAAEKARQDADTAAQQFQDATTTAAAKRLDFLEGIQEELLTKADEYKPALNSAADKAFEDVYQALKQNLEQGPQQAISQIQVQAGAITDSAAAKAAEVQQGLSAERAVTVQAIQALAPQPQDTAAITQAVNEVGNSIREQGNATISALATVAATSKGITARLEAQQRQIEQIFARIR